jgi:hypothetical protein
MSRWYGLFEVGIGLVIIVLSIPIIMIFFPEGPNLPESLMGSVSIFVGIVLMIDGLRRSILKGRKKYLPGISDDEMYSLQPAFT